MKTISRTLFILLLAFSWSCSNDDDSIVNNDSDANNGDPDSMEVLNSRLSSYTIEDVEFEFTYDESDGKMTRFQYGTTFTVNASITYDDNGRIMSIGPTEYLYDDQDRVIRFDKGEFSSAEYTYDTAGRIIEIAARHPNSTRDGANTSFTTIDYNSEGLPDVVNNINTREEIGTPEYFRTILSYDSKGNLTQKYIENGLDGINYMYFSNTTYTYDDKKNPFREAIESTGISRTFHLEQFIGLNSTFINLLARTGIIYFTSTNNLLTETNDFTTTTHEYTYNDDGYPETLIRTFDGTSGGGGISVRTHGFNYQDY